MHTPDNNPEGARSFSATLRVDPQPSGKKFQGVWLEREDGERWLIAYRPWGYWTIFQDERVTVTGERYEPVGQAMGAPHFRVHSLKLAGDSQAPWTELGPERELHGTLRVVAGAPGSKMADETWPVFDEEGGGAYQLANAIALEGLLERPLVIKARSVTRSPFAAHMPGPTIWVIQAAPAP